jgi:hypothetical protein
MRRDGERTIEMRAFVKFVIAAAFAGGFGAFASAPAQALPVATSGVDAGVVTEQAHAVRVCNRFGRCWMTFAHAHPRFYGYHRPYRYGWRRGYYGYGRHWGWRHPYYGRHWR